MKKLTIALLFPILSFSQLRFNDVEYFTFSVISDPVASVKESGLYIGGEIEYVGTIYTREGVSNFSVLQDGYTSLIGGIGLNLTSGYFNKIRYYAGVRLGVVTRAASNGTAGIEAGIDFSIDENAFLGLRTTYNYHSDKDFYTYTNYMTNSNFIRFGIRF